MAKTGWVIEIVSGVHLAEFGRTFYKRGSCGYATLLLVEADVQETRRLARIMSFDDSTEVVRKVELDEQGRAVKIIPGR